MREKIGVVNRKCKETYFYIVKWCRTNMKQHMFSLNYEVIKSQFARSLKNKKLLVKNRCKALFWVGGPEVIQTSDHWKAYPTLDQLNYPSKLRS